MEQQQPTRTPKVDVIIVGAGISGLTTAWKILQKERTLQVKILEARNVVGGHVGDTLLGEIGGKWITEDQYHIHQLLKELKIPTRKRVILGSKLPRCWVLDRGPWAFLARFELKRYIRQLELHSRLYRPGKFDARMRSPSMRHHIYQNLFFNQSRKFISSLVQLCSGVEPQFITFAAFMSICYTCGGLQHLIDIHIECPTSLLEFSSSKLLQALLDKLRSTEVLLWRRVQEIRQYRDVVEVCDSAHELHTADVVVLAVPWNSIQEMIMVPAMPLELRIPPLPIEKSRTMITSFLVQYQAAHWRNAGYSGQFMCNEPQLLIGHEYRPATYCGMMMHEEGIEPLVRSMALQTLAHHYGNAMLLPNDYAQRTYELSSLANVPFTTPWHRVIWSSSASTATHYRGCLSGAVQSGKRAAVNSLLMLRPQALGWQDIAEIHHAFDSAGQKQHGWLSLWFSSWNLYRVTSYTLLALSVYLGMSIIYKRCIHHN